MKTAPKNLLVCITLIALINFAAWLAIHTDQGRDTEMERVSKILDCLDEQSTALTNSMNAGLQELKCQIAGDAKGAAMWHSNFIIFDRQEHEAYLRLKSLTQ